MRSRCIGVGMIISFLAITGTLIIILSAREKVQHEQREQQLVYEVWAYSGEKYENILYPQAVDTLYLISNMDNVLVPKLTEVYYWTLDSEYKADWMALNRLLTGEIVITQRGKEVARLEQQPFALIYDRIIPRYVTFGKQAEDAYQRFQKESKHVSEELDIYYQANIEYQVAYEQYLDEIKAGNTLAERPEPPGIAYPQIESYVSSPELAYKVNLPPGNYELALHTKDGKLVESSWKKLHVFKANREGIGYKVFVTERWTFPETGADPQESFYVKPGTSLYLEPYYAKEYRTDEYNRLLKPQQKNTGPATMMWILSEPYSTGAMKVRSNQREAVPISARPYGVRQTSGPTLGYTIEPYEPQADDEALPTFTAFRVEIQEGIDRYQIEMVNQQGIPLAGSIRTVKVIHETQPGRLYIFSASPLVLGAVIIGWRRLTIYKRRRN